MIAVVLGTHHFVKRHFPRAPIALVALDGVPRHGERARVLDAYVYLQALAAVHEPEAFDYMKLRRVRGAIIVTYVLSFIPIVSTTRVSPFS